MYDELPTERLEHEVTSAAGRLAAETCRFLLLVAELDRREAWATWGSRSCAHWLSWRCGIGLRTAHDHVRVGHLLARLPLTVAAFERGELSYSKVRALTRIASPEIEAELVELARTATAAQLERIVSAAVVAATPPAEVAEHRGLHLRSEELLGQVRARLLPEQLAVVEAAVDASVAAMPVDECSAEQSLAVRRADALVAICEEYLSRHEQVSRPGEDRQQLVLHVDADVVAGRKAAALEGSGLLLHPDTARRLACDCQVLVLFERDGVTIGAGRRTRTISKRMRRALQRRSRGMCEWPGCDHRWHLQAHHIWHWEDGGPTELGNLVNLCWTHHHAVHDRGFRVCRDGGLLRAFRPDGTELHATAVVTAGPSHVPDDLAPDAPVARWAGERLDLGLAVDAVLGLRRQDRQAA